MRKKTWMTTGRVLMIVAIATLLLTNGSSYAQQKQAQQGIKASKGKPPDRNGNGQVDSEDPGPNETSCPPVQADGTRFPTDPNMGDKDVNNDGTDDYYMGESKYEKGDQDLKVREWCINGTTPYYTYEIVTSEHEGSQWVDTVAVDPDDEMI